MADTIIMKVTFFGGSVARCAWQRRRHQRYRCRKRVATCYPVCKSESIKTTKVEATRMNSEGKVFPGHAFDDGGVRNPFGVIDVPSLTDQEDIAAFAAAAMIDGSARDENAIAWSTVDARDRRSGIEGTWSSRWNGGVDGTIPGDAKCNWKQGRAEVRTAGQRVYLLFDWSYGSRRGLVEAKHEDAHRLIGKYINLTDPAITRPWGGLIVSDRRIDGCWPGGRLDFRR
jgi:hypothetical protein